MPAAAASELKLRLLSAGIFIPGLVGLSWIGGWAFLVLVLAIVLRVCWELYALLAQAGFRPQRLVGMALAGGFCLHFYLFGAARLELLMGLGVPVVLLAALRQGTKGYIVNAFLTLGGALYIGFLGASALLLARAAGPQHAPYLLLAIFLCIGLTDTGAYACGRLWGRRKLAPSISPGKTVVGFLGGIVVGLTPLPLAGLAGFPSLWVFAGLLLLVSVGGQLGDLVESAIKRDVGVKDAPSLIPGHGGALDRFDSAFFAFPLAYLYIETYGFILNLNFNMW